jgi:four helix bundle protein
MNPPQQFEDLDAWCAARELASRIYSLCRIEPLVRDFGLVDQMRRAAVSAMNNIAEGWETAHVAEKIQFYNFARRSCGELRSMSYVLLDNRYVPAPEHDALRTECVRVGRLISGLIRSSEKRL